MSVRVRCAHGLAFWQQLHHSLLIFQGLTMKPLVKWLKVKRVEPSELKLIEKVNNRVT